MQIVLADGEAFEVEEKGGNGENIINMWDGLDSTGLMVRFIRYREHPDQLYFLRYPKTRWGAFTKGRYVTNFTVWA